MGPGALAYTYLGYAGREAAFGQAGAIRKAVLALALLAAVAVLPDVARDRVVAAKPRCRLLAYPSWPRIRAVGGPLAGHHRLGGDARELGARLLPKVPVRRPFVHQDAADIEQPDACTTHQAVLAERALLRGLGGGCQVPIAAASVVRGEELALRGAVLSPDGTQRIEAGLAGPLAEAPALGQALAELWRSQRRVAYSRFGAGRTRWESHRTNVHRGPLRRVSLSRALRHRLCQPARVASSP